MFWQNTHCSHGSLNRLPGVVREGPLYEATSLCSVPLPRRKEDQKVGEVPYE
jgi:hypothetical protein